MISSENIIALLKIGFKPVPLNELSTSHTLPLVLYIQQRMPGVSRYPIKKAHYVGTSEVLTIDPFHVKRLGIDDLTFFLEKPMQNGMLLKMRKMEPAPNKGD